MSKVVLKIFVVQLLFLFNIYGYKVFDKLPNVKQMASESSSEKVFYISPDGNDRNIGSEENPFATLERGKLAIIDNTGKSITLFLRKGYYSLEETFVLSNNEISSNTQILISSFPGEQAHIIGGKEIGGFTKLNSKSEAYRIVNSEIRDSIYVVNLIEKGITNFGELSARGFGRAIQPAGLELYFNERPMTLARWPNDDWTTIEDVPDSLDSKGFTYRENRPSKWLNAPDLWLHGYWKYDWADTYVKVASVDTASKTIITEEPYSGYPFAKGKRYYALNLLEELDAPGEWYLDRENGNLYFWAPSEIDKGRTFVSNLQKPLIQIVNLSNITIKNLTLEYTSGAGIEIIEGNNNKIDGCVLRNIGTVAVSIGRLIPNPGGTIYKNTLYDGEAGTNNGVLNSEIYAVGEGGIILRGGSRITLTPGKNYAVNNNIYDCSRWVRTYRAGIFMQGVGNIVRNNLIHDLPHTAVFFWGNNHILEFNEIHHVCMETGDAGAFYIGRDWTQRGSIIRNNYFHHLHGVEGQEGWNEVMAIYLDDWASGTTIVGNVFYKAGRTVMIGGGRDNLVENNIIIDGSPAIHVDARGLGWAKSYFDGTNNTLFERLEVVEPNKPPYSEQYPQLITLLEDEPVLPKGNRIVRNISSGGKWVELLNNLTDSLIYFENNSIDIDRGLLMTVDNKIEINHNSKLFPSGFKKIPFEKIGLKK